MCLEHFLRQCFAALFFYMLSCCYFTVENRKYLQAKLFEIIHKENYIIPCSIVVYLGVEPFVIYRNMSQNY